MHSIETDRLLLEPLQGRHADVLFSGLADARLYEFIEDTPPFSIEELRKRYERLELRTSPDGSESWLNWAIYSVADAKYIGYVQATLYGTATANLGYVVFFADWGKGHGTDAVRAVADYLKADCGTTRFVATVDERNERSRRLLKQLGFLECRRTSLQSGATDVTFEKYV